MDTTGWRGTTETLAMLPIVQEGVSRDRKLAFAYWRAGRERVERIVDPLGLVAKGSTWYLVANTPAGFRTYRVSRIEDAKMLDVPSERPANFDLAAYWESSTEEFREGWKRYHVTLRLEQHAAERMKMWLIASSTQDGAGAEGASPGTDAEGWITLHVQFGHQDEAFFVVMGLGAEVEVMEPASLRERVAGGVAAVIERARNSGRAAG